MKFFLFFLVIGFEFFGAQYILYTDYQAFLLYSLFIVINAFFIWNFINKSILKTNIIYVFTFIAWLSYNALGFIHTSAIQQLRNIPREDWILWIYFLLILSSFLIYIPIKIMQNINFHSVSFLKNFVIHPQTIILLICIGFALNLYKIHIAGGLESFINAAYGAKVESSYMTFFNLFIGITSNIIFIILPYMFLKQKSLIKILAIIYLLFYIIIGCLNGSSMSIMTPVIALFTYALFMTKKANKKKLKRFFIIGLTVGIVGGMLIRVNRKHDKEFTIHNIEQAFNEIITSATFDNVTNLQYILGHMEPINQPQQFILPYVHYLPRNIFTWKPVELGRIIGYKHVGVNKDSKVAFLSSPIGDFYYDFGLIGIILGMLFVGFFIGYIQEKLNTLPQSPFILSIIIAFSLQFTGLSAWYTGCFTAIVRLLILYFMVILIEKIISLKKQYY